MTELPDDLKLIDEKKLRNKPEFSSVLAGYHAMMKNGASPAIGYSQKLKRFIICDIGKV